MFVILIPIHQVNFFIYFFENEILFNEIELNLLNFSEALVKLKGIWTVWLLFVNQSMVGVDGSFVFYIGVV